MTRFLTPKQVCAQIALSRSTLDRLVSAGKFPAPIKLTERRLAYSQAAVEEWMAEKAESA